MKLTQLSFAALLSIASVGAFAQAKAPEPDYTLAYNVGTVTDYRFRGIMQTQGTAAIQGGADYAHKSGLYAGAWASNIRWIRQTCLSLATSCGKSLELDLYGGYKGEVTTGVGYDVGLISYQYLGNKLKAAPGYVNANTTEVYAGLSYGPVSAKYSRSVSNMLGVPNSSGSNYLEVNGNFDLGSGFTLVAHVGHQKWKNSPVFDYTDYKLGVNKDMGGGFTLGASFVDTDAKAASWTYNGENWGKSTVVLSASYAF